ncbi:TIM barrel protein [Clostridiaceae bacterium M8S5]|nr:TIM barrel protein [Clostridiaceae bacterium M8S5]
MMIEIGRNVRYFRQYKDEVEFSKDNGFVFVQIWYDKNGIGLQKDSEPRLKAIKDTDYKSIIHAVLDINEFEKHIPILKTMMCELKHKDIIIHPICQSEDINEFTIYKLSRKVGYALDEFSSIGVKLYLENNSKIDPIFTTTKEIQIMFEENKELEFLLDVAHIDDYNHLKEMINIKMPKILHIADRHFDVIHEHLPLGCGEIDYELVLDILKGFSGKLILEIDQSDEDIIRSKQLIEKIINKN